MIECGRGSSAADRRWVENRDERSRAEPFRRLGNPSIHRMRHVPTKQTRRPAPDTAQVIDATGQQPAGNNHDDSETISRETAHRAGAVMDIAELKNKKIEDLIKVANELRIANTSGLRKQELIFEILEAQTKKNGLIFSEGVLQILPE